jgi:ATP-dependent exoDNAse (exonuclease V) beta subunit
MKYIDFNHTYENKDGKLYTSVTQLVKKYIPKQDWDEIAAKYAKKHKMPVEDVKAKWKHEGDISLIRGNAFHKTQEELFPEGPIVYQGKKTFVYPSPLIDGIKLAKELKDLKEGIYPELLIYSDRYQIAGQADFIACIDNKLIVHDYKTNKKIDRESYKDWKKGHRMMNTPLGNLMDCNFDHYSLQLNLYMFMLKAHNPQYEIGEMIIKHATHENDFFGNPIVKILEVPNLQKDVKRLLDHYAGK